MAITRVSYALLREVARTIEFVRPPRILQFGAANWYNDAPPSIIAYDLELADGRRHALADTIQAYSQKPSDKLNLFDVAETAYCVLFGNTERPVSIDLDPAAPGARRLDLNEPIQLGEQFDILLNSGTLEHVFDIAQGFRTAHEHTKVGGLMIHESPYCGWTEHSFYALQGTLYFDLAAANNYVIELMATQHLPSGTATRIASLEELTEMRRRDVMPRDLMLFVCLRKTSDAPFQIPMQGIYNGSLSPDAANAWKELR